MVFVLFVFCDVSLSWYACCLSVILVGLWLLVIAVWLVWWLCIALCDWVRGGFDFGDFGCLFGGSLCML